MRFAIKDFFLQVVSRKKEEKSSTDKLPTTRFAVEFFCHTSCSNQESEGFFYRQATYKGKYGKAKEAVESTKAGLSPQKRGCEKVKKRKRPRKAGLSPQEGDVRKKRKSPRMAGLSPQEGDKKKKRREKDQGRQEGGSSESKVPCALNQEFLFLVHEYLGLGSGPTWLKYRLLQDLVYEEAMCKRMFQKQTTLRSKSSTLKRTTLRMLKILLQSIVARKVRTIALEQSPKKAVMRHAINAIWHRYIGNPAAKYL
jgi:hypothetical protein